MNQATWKDTFDHMFGSGATSYSWWQELAFSGMESNGYEPTENWSVKLTCEDGSEGTKSATINHESVMEAARELLRMYLSKDDAGKPNVNDDVIRQCAMLIFEARDCDFDASSADCLLQLMVLNDVVFG